MSALTGEFYHVTNFQTRVYRPLIFQVIYVIVPPAGMVSSRPSSPKTKLKEKIEYEREQNS